MALQDDALRLVELDRLVFQTLMEGISEEGSRVLGEYLELRISLKSKMLDESVVSIEDGMAREVLHKISNGEGLPTDGFVKRLEELSGDDLALGEFDDVDIERLGSELFYSWFSHHEYVNALAELRPLILRSDAPQSVRRLVQEAKDCYAFQQYDAAFALCRMLIEASIRDICVRRGLLPEPDDKVVLLEKYSWRSLRNKVSCGSLNEKLEILYGRLCEVSHARRSATAEEARAMFRETLSAIEELYGNHGL